MRRRIAGMNLDGRVDIAARDWSPEDPTLRLDRPAVIDGGVAAPIVVAGIDHPYESYVTTLAGGRIAECLACDSDSVPGVGSGSS